ncbi:transcriptional regulator [Clostridium beijerinckii]|uniref:Transcriptional regulator n=1 Tax=Clostridium beijerinckii TaxID=1520 RepID=A0A0B5Q7Z7_CLOBE|nr:helix-turn-helix domain-containing protein [Clostridium beijerinckii]AJG98289.1 transcriptional regulator [Clostridium beijerinckii]
MEKNKHLPFKLIVYAANGDEETIKKILNFYDGYISKLSLRQMYDEYGNVYIVVDSELKGKLQEAVMKMVLNFEIAVI